MPQSIGSQRHRVGHDSVTKQIPCVHAQSRPTLCDPMDVAHQAPLSFGFIRQEYWSGLPFPGDLLYPGIKAKSPALVGGFLTPDSPGKLFSDLNILN